MDNKWVVKIRMFDLCFTTSSAHSVHFTGTSACLRVDIIEFIL